MAMPVYLTDGLFARGEFTYADAASSGALLLHYGWGLPAFILIKILQPAFFARGDTKTPMRFSLISVAVNIVLGVALFYTIGFPRIRTARPASSTSGIRPAILNLAPRPVRWAFASFPTRASTPKNGRPLMAALAATPAGPVSTAAWTAAPASNPTAG